MTHLANPILDSDQDREHCRLDLDAIRDDASAARFVSRWRHALRDFLIDPPEPPHVDTEREEWAKRERELGDALSDALSDAMDVLQLAARNLERAASDAEDLHLDDPNDQHAGALAEKLLEVADKLSDLRLKLRDA